MFGGGLVTVAVCVLMQIYKEDCLDLLVPANKRDKDQITIREDVAGGIKVSGVPAACGDSVMTRHW